MSQDTGRTSDDASAKALREFLALEHPASCEADAVRDIVERAIRQCRPDEPSEDALIHDAMVGVVRGTFATHMHARQTARGAIAGVMRSIDGIPGYSALAAFTSAARALILETAASQGQIGAITHGILDAVCGEGSRGLTRQQVLSVVALAIVDATAESNGRPASNDNCSTE